MLLIFHPDRGSIVAALIFRKERRPGEASCRWRGRGCGIFGFGGCSYLIGAN
ncbi:MAG: hypothetical protein HXX15_20750 [Rhodopseudomonas sp.]|uniref:hypothetical protein n=1 Tax=Rhodopseudomonas sp. TaxID=1078 RepID=UPI00178F321B|nr:hypothetical protein [Rhodopseudomonas sp.]NVN88516.1 hypothetical protein [Rhodopseudomonas sp.]